MSDSASPWTAEYKSPLSFTISISVCWNSCPLNQWYHLTISSTLFSFFLQSFSASGSFLMSQLFASRGRSTGVSASAPVLPKNIQGWFPLEMTGLILQSMGFSRVFFSTTTQKHQFFGVQPSLWSNSDIHTWLLEKP